MGVRISPDAKAPEDEGAFEVWEENWNTVLVFLALETQWLRLAGPTGLIWLGINYEVIETVQRLTKIPDDVFEGLRIMEAAALKILSQSR